MPWDSPVSRLIHGVSKEFGEERYRILRRPIHVSESLSEWDKNLVRVCAKRFAASSNTMELAGESRVVDIGSDINPDQESYRHAELRGTVATPDEIQHMIGKISDAEREKWKHSALHRAPRCVVAALIGPDGKILEINANTNSAIQMRHAELNLLLALHESGFKTIPHGSTLYVTLKPCRMCASLIIAMQETPYPIRVVALADDPGPHGRHQLLAGLELSLARP